MSEKHESDEQRSSLRTSSDGHLESTSGVDVGEYRLIRKKKKRKAQHKQNISSRASSTRSGSRTQFPSLPDDISLYTDNYYKTKVTVLLDGLPIKHVSKDEWDQIGTEFLTSQPHAAELAECIVDDRKCNKEVMPVVSSFSDHKMLFVTIKTPVEFAITVQSWFHAVYSICQGLLGGLALSHFVLAYSATEPFQDVTGFASVYSTFAKPYQAMFYFLVVLCMMSILDNCGLRSLYEIYTMLKLKPSVLVILLVYGVTLVLTCQTSYWDLRISIPQNSTQLENSGVGTWRTLSLLRCVGGAVGYFLTSLFPSTDLINLRLECMRNVQNIQPFTLA